MKGERLPMAQDIHKKTRKSYGAFEGPPSTMPRAPASGYGPSLYTEHGKGLIDMVLAFQPVNMNQSQLAYEELFETKLREAGLYLERTDLAESQDGKTTYVKIHGQWNFLMKQAEIRRTRVPLKLNNPHMLDDNDVLLGEFTAEFDRHKFKLFARQNPDTFFTSTQRINIVYEVINETMIHASEIDGIKVARLPGHNANVSVGFNFLLKQRVFNSIYPLHDGDCALSFGEKIVPPHLQPLRPWLFEHWARPLRNLFKKQPIDRVCAYFGSKVALYFAWLGFYTGLLIPMALAGLLVFIYGLISMPSDLVVKQLKDSCKNAKITAVFNNYATMIYAVFAAIWCVLFLELWKRREAVFSCKWDTYDFEEELQPLRPDYIAQATSRRRNAVTAEWEAFVPARTRMQRIAASASTILFLVFVVLGVIASITLYKVTMVSVYYSMHNNLINKLGGSETFTSMSGSAINAVCIIMLENLYGIVAWRLTEREYPRTDDDFEKSFSLKMYLFQFVNYYATLYYLAFVQPFLGGVPNDDSILTDRCPPAGCTLNATIQLAIVLIFKQAIQNTMEIGMPMLKNWWRRRKNVADSDDNQYVRHEKDFDLQKLDQFPLFGEYFEMIMQYGFVAMFVAVFPLAPLLALVNNVCEIRIDALKFIKESRRVVPREAKDIGLWYGLLKFVTRLAVLTNGLIIALTTDLVDRIVYQTMYSEDGTLAGYVNWSLATFHTGDWNKDGLMVDAHFGNVTTCRYMGHFQGPGDEHPYSVNTAWWHVNFGKIAFLLVFENLLKQSFASSTADDQDDYGPGGTAALNGSQVTKRRGSPHRPQSPRKQPPGSEVSVQPHDSVSQKYREGSPMDDRSKKSKGIFGGFLKGKSRNKDTTSLIAE